MTRTHTSWLVATVVLVAGAAIEPRTATAQSHYLGEIKWVAFDVTPDGWAPCDGAILPIAQNTALFALLGTTYGGNGQTTYALPDMRSRFLVHHGHGPGLAQYDQRQMAGEEAHALTVDELPAHSHAVSDHAHPISPLTVDVKASSGAATSAAASGGALATATLSSGSGTKITGVYGIGPADVSLGSTAASTTTGITGASGATTSAAGAGQAHSLMPPFLTLRCIIAIKGAFPPRS